MTDSNLVRLAYVKETQWGTTPTTPAMRALRYTGEDLSYAIETIQSAEIVSDRQVTDLIQTSARVSGGYRFELSYKEHDEFFAGALESAWTIMPERDNLGTADSIITDIGTVAQTFAVASGGGAFVTGHLAQASGNANAANNLIFRVASSSGTTVVGAGLSLIAEAAPLATSRLKVVGFQGASGDIAATTTGLSSTLLNFTTLGLAVGQFIKIGGTAVGDKFDTVADNTWTRITSLSANALTLDHRPAAWAADAGAGKTLKVWTIDTLWNGVTPSSFTIEVGYTGQATPTYLPLEGCVPDQLSLNIAPGAVVNGALTFLGKAAATATTTPLDATVTGSYGGDVINAVANVVQISEGGSPIVGPAFVTGLTVQTTNNLRDKTAVGTMGLVGVGHGQFAVTGTLGVYFENVTILNKLISGTATSLSVVFAKGGSSYILHLPNVKLSGGTPASGGLNQEVLLEMDFTALKDPIIGKTMLIGRADYIE